MHIPDGFLSITTSAGAYLVSAGGVGYASREAGKKLGEKHVPLMGVLAAFIFAGQMINFPIPGGTSGHLMGAALAAILLGPWAAVLIMSCVLLVQSLVFQDGGLIALGANVLNMGIVASFVGYYSYRGIVLVLGQEGRRTLIAGFVAAWSSVFVASLACALELAISGTSPAQVVFPAMAGFHAVIGIGEGLITGTVLSYVMVTRSDLLELQKV